MATTVQKARVKGGGEEKGEGKEKETVAENAYANKGAVSFSPGRWIAPSLTSRQLRTASGNIDGSVEYHER